MNVFFEWLRRVAFWSLDALRGGRVRKHFKEIQLVLTAPESERAKKIRQSNLENILKHAKESVPFYEKNSKSGASLQDFPIVDKHIVRENFDEFRSKNLITGKNHLVTTSGSTGKPFSIYQDPNKKARNTADTIFFAGRGGYRLGSRLFYLRLWDKQYKKNKFLSILQNMATYSVDDLTEENLEKMIEELSGSGTRCSILAYTSSLETICSHIEQNHEMPLDCKLDSVIAVAEALSRSTNDRIKACLGIKAISRYSNSENGIFAQQSIYDKSDNFEVNWASYQIELLDLHSNNPVKHGETGRIVITDLFNYAMPLIRYDTGDVGKMEYDTNYGRIVLKQIDGRKMDMFTNTKGEIISSHIIHHILQYPGIDQFQFIEEENGEYIIKIKVLLNFNFEDGNKICKQYAGYFGEKSIVRIEYVEDIPLLASGKRKLVINKRLMKAPNHSQTEIQTY